MSDDTALGDHAVPGDEVVLDEAVLDDAVLGDDAALGDGSRGRHSVRWIALGTAVVLAFLVIVLAIEKQNSDDTNFRLRGQPAPALSGATLQGGTFTLARPPGKWVVVNFYASWCVPCQQEAPQIAKFADEHASTGDAQVVSVAFDPSDARKAASYFDGNGGPPGPVIVRDGDVLGVNWSVNKVPETYLVAPNGIVVWKSVEPVTQRQLDTMIQKAGGDAMLPATTTSAPGAARAEAP